MNVDLAIDVNGTIELSERNEPSDSDAKTCSSISLVSAEGDNIELRIGYTDNEDERDNIGFFIDFSKYHMANDETKRVFHCNVSLTPKHADFRQLRDFLSFLLALPETVGA